MPHGHLLLQASFNKESHDLVLYNLLIREQYLLDELVLLFDRHAEEKSP